MMLEFFDINYNGKMLRGIKHVNVNNKICVSFIHGIPGDRVDARRVNVRIAKNLERLKVDSIRLDLIGTGISDGDFLEVSYKAYEAQLELIYAYMKQNKYEKIIFLGFSDSAKILVRFANIHKDVILILCNGIIDNSEAKELLPLKKAHRVRGCFAFDSNCGLWYNVNLFKEKIVFELEEIISEKRVYFIYGNDDILCKSSIKKIKETGGELLLVDKGDHLFTNRYAENILLSKIEFIIKKIVEKGEAIEICKVGNI